MHVIPACRLRKGLTTLAHLTNRSALFFASLTILSILGFSTSAQDKEPTQKKEPARKARVTLLKPGLFKSITNPPCSYCVVQHRKGLIKQDDRAIAWLRSSHDGGAIPLRHFLAAPRVVNDTYGIFFYDPDGGYVSAFERSPKFKHVYEFHGWRNGVMMVKGNDGSLVSALSGEVFSGPRKGERLKRIPNMMTDWQYWLKLHPDSVAYRMYDGKKYKLAPLPTEQSKEAGESMGPVDARLKAFSNVIGVTAGGHSKAFPLDNADEHAVFVDTVGDQPVTVFWYGSTKTAVAFSSMLDGQQLTIIANKGGDVPFRDKETGTRWSLAGRGIDGELKGKELKWVDSIQCHWYAWSSEYPDTELFSADR
ncbi:MAG: DUF3179 domain-containing protein [Planctomycetes bacterium]|nr:DUF3179 domain-containing protein [Planctomycetota bacterium]